MLRRLLHRAEGRARAVNGLFGDASLLLQLEEASEICLNDGPVCAMTEPLDEGAPPLNVSVLVQPDEYGCVSLSDSGALSRLQCGLSNKL